MTNVRHAFSTVLLATHAACGPGFESSHSEFAKLQRRLGQWTDCATTARFRSEATDFTLDRHTSS